MDLATPLKFVKGVGPARALVLESKGLLTVEDLLGYAPFRYEDRSNVTTIAQLAPGELATVVAQVQSSTLSGFRRRNLGLFEASFTDNSRNSLTAKGFHGGYLADRFKPVEKVALFGKIELDSCTGDLLDAEAIQRREIALPAKRAWSRSWKLCENFGAFPSSLMRSKTLMCQHECGFVVRRPNGLYIRVGSEEGVVQCIGATISHSRKHQRFSGILSRS